ncbi:MAG TPA: hypothetical protein EYN66_13090 [Myxococcales bacterium]|nr:hypothetical protein [Myxococcales bacterium]
MQRLLPIFFVTLWACSAEPAVVSLPNDDTGSNSPRQKQDRGDDAGTISPDSESTETETDAPTPEEIAFHFAPIWYQDTANGGPDDQGARADLPIAVDFDGDLQHNNNWEALPGLELWPALYYGIVSTESHHFLTYSQYHPRDWELVCLGLTGACHEGDLESIWIVVERDTSTFGQIVLIRTHHHGKDSVWSNQKGLAGNFKVAGTMDFADLEGRVSNSEQHVRIFSEAHGHGTAPCAAQKNTIKPYGIMALSCPDSSGKKFPGDDGVVLTPSIHAVAPWSDDMPKSKQVVTYQLLAIEDTLWHWRHELGENLIYRQKDAFIYLGNRGIPFVSEGSINTHFDVKQFTNDNATGSVPWSRTLPGSAKGDVFLDPAHAYQQFLNAQDASWSLKYQFHPYLPKSIHE